MRTSLYGAAKPSCKPHGRVEWLTDRYQYLSLLIDCKSGMESPKNR